MSGLQPIVGQFRATPLNTDFGHSPIGNLGARSVQQGRADAPRSAGRALAEFGSQVKQLASRVLNAVTPHGMRAENKFRAGLEATSKQVGDLLGALSKTGRHQVDGMSAKNLIETLRDTAQPMLSRGADYDRVFEQRVAVNTSKMSAGELLALRDGLNLSNNSALKDDPTIKAHLDTIGRAVTSELSKRAIQEGIQKLGPLMARCEAQAQHEMEYPGSVNAIFATLYQEAQGICNEYGFNKLESALIRETLNELAATSPERSESISRMIGTLSSPALHALINDAGVIKGEAATIKGILSDASDLRLREASAGFQSGVEKLLGHKEPVSEDLGGPLHDPKGFVRELVDMAKNLRVLHEHAEVTGVPLDEGVDPNVVLVQSHLEELLTPGNLALEKLDNGELHDLEHAMETFGADTQFDEIQEEMTKRRNAARVPRSKAFDAVLAAIRDGNTGGLPEVMMTLRERSDACLRVSQELGTDFHSPEKISEFRLGLSTSYLDSLPTEELTALHDAFQTPEVRLFAAGLADVANTLLSTRDPEPELHLRGHQALGMLNDLKGIGEALSSALAKKGVVPPPPPPLHGDLSQEGQDAIRDAFGMAPGKEMRMEVGEASAGIQQIFDERLHTKLTLGELQVHQLPDGGGSSGVAGTFWRDLGRAHYSITDEGGQATKLIDRSNWNNLDPKTQAERSMGAIEQLRALTGNDEMLLFVSQYAHQGIMAGLQEALMSDQSPMRLPDGTAGRLMGPEGVNYNFSRTPEGNIVLRGEYAVHDATDFFSPATGITPLDPATSRSHFTFELTFTKDRQILVTEPLKYLFNVTPPPQ